MGLVWLWPSLSHILIPPFWYGDGYSILWGADEVLSKCVLLTQAWLCRGLQWVIPMAMVNLPQTRLRTMAKPSFGSDCEY